MVFNQATRRK